MRSRFAPPASLLRAGLLAGLLAAVAAPAPAHGQRSSPEARVGVEASIPVAVEASIPVAVEASIPVADAPAAVDGTTVSSAASSASSVPAEASFPHAGADFGDGPAPVPAPPAADAAVLEDPVDERDPVERLLAAWFEKHFHGLGGNMTEFMHNHLRTAVEDLREELRALSTIVS